MYLSRQGVHAGPYFGPGLQGGEEGDRPGSICVRLDTAGLRTPAWAQLEPDHWYRVWLTIPAGAQSGSVGVMDLTAGETEFRPVKFDAGETEIDLTEGETWHPTLTDLDTLILRLGSGAQVAGVLLENR